MGDLAPKCRLMPRAMLRRMMPMDAVDARPLAADAVEDLVRAVEMAAGHVPAPISPPSNDALPLPKRSELSHSDRRSPCDRLRVTHMV